MKFHVFYLDQQYSRDSSFITVDDVNAEHYSKVTEAEANDLEDLFRRMNVVDGSEIELVGRGPGKLPIRSLSVGDVVVDEKGQAHLCAMVGWEPIPTLAFR